MAGRRGSWSDGSRRRAAPAPSGGSDDGAVPSRSDPEQHPGDPEAVARAICLRLLTQRARSRAELADALDARDVPAAVADRVLDRFTEVGLIDDTVDAAVATIDADSERRRAEQLVAKRLPSVAGLPPEVQQRRLVGLLARKGYPPGLVYEVVRSAVAAGRSGEFDPLVLD